MDSLSLQDNDDQFDDCPSYAEYTMDNLRPMTPLGNNRYEKTADVVLSHVIIEPGLFHFTCGPEPVYLPRGWTAYTHPEGQLYFYRNIELRVVTEAYLYRPEVMAKIASWTAMVQEALKIKGIKFTGAIELFLEPREDMESCGYYLVDHSTRSEFWIDQVSTELLGLPQVVSMSHLRSALEELYWTHLEYFPMHVDDLTADTVDELISVFSHGQTDRMTSSTSTFPYPVDECAKFIKVLKNARMQEMDGHLTWITARLWCQIARHKFAHFSGQEFPRLDKGQAILGTRPDMDHWMFGLCSSLLFGQPELHSARFDKIYVDNEVDVKDFRTLVSDCLDDWKSSLSWSLPLLMSNIMLSYTPSASRIIGISSIIVCGLSSTFGIVLSVRYESFEKATSSIAYRHIDSIRSNIYGFRPYSCVFSLPRALCIWGLGLLMLQVMYLTFRLISTSIALLWTTLVLAIILGAGQIMFPESECPWIRIAGAFKHGLKWDVAKQAISMITNKWTLADTDMTYTREVDGVVEFWRDGEVSL